MSGQRTIAFGKRGRNKAPEQPANIVEAYQRADDGPKLTLYEKMNSWKTVGYISAVSLTIIMSSLIAVSIKNANRTPEEIARTEMQEAAKAAKDYAEARTTSCRKDRKIEVFTLVQMQIKNAVRSPSTATFNIAQSDIRLVEDCLYKIRSFVDSQNGFGAIVRTPWSATVEWIPETGGWKLRKIDLG